MYMVKTQQNNSTKGKTKTVIYKIEYFVNDEKVMSDE